MGSSWVGDGIGWGWGGVFYPGPKIHPVGWLGGWKSDYIATSAQPTGFSHRSECGKNLRELCHTIQIEIGRGGDGGA